MIHFRYGFTYNNLNYGWYNKELYRFPFNKYGKYYSLYKLKLIIIGNNIGYRLSGNKKTLKQLKELTNLINYKYNNFINSDLPF